MRRLAASLCVACCVAQTQNPACERAAAATGGLIAWNATAKRCEPDVCDGSPEGILDFFATPPPPAEGQHYVKKLGAGFCDHVQTESAYARWRPGFVPSRLACGQRLFDAPAARSCLAKKRVVFLGDSTLTEVVHGLVMTLFGDGTQCGRRLALETRQKKKPTRREKRKHRDNAGKHRDDARPANPRQCGSAASYLKRLASVMKLKHSAPYHSKPLAFDRVTVKFEGAGPYGAKNKCARPAENRRFSAKFGDVLLQHRWTGATNPCNRPGGEGLTALVDGKLGAVDLFLDRPDTIAFVVVASGVHDLHLGPWDATAKSAKIDKPPRSRDDYAALVNRSFSRLEALGVPARRVVWLSNNRLGRCNDGGILGAYDAAAEAEAARRGAAFVDGSEVLERHFAQPFLATCCGDDLGIHRGVILKVSDPSKLLVASAFEIQSLLGALCGGAVGAAEEAATTEAALQSENARLRERLAAAEARAAAAEASLAAATRGDNATGRPPG